MIFPQATTYPSVLQTSRPTSAAGAIEQMSYVCLFLFAFATPWSEAGLTVSGIEVNRWFGLAACGLAFLSTRYQVRSNRFSDLHFWMFAFAGWSITSLFWTIDREDTLARAGTYIQLLLLIWVIRVLCSSESRVAGLLQAYILGTCVCAIGTIANLVSGRTMGQLDGMQGAGADRYTIDGVNPNDLGVMLALSIPMTLYLLVRRRGGRWGSLLCWVQLALAVTGILLSGSRTSALAATGAFVMLPLVLVRFSLWQRATMAIAVAGIVAAAIAVLPAETWNRFLHLGDEISQGTMTHRTQIWAASEVIFREHPLVGVGSGAHATAVAGLLGRPLVAHNTFFSALAELGVVGELLLLGLLSAAFYCAMTMPRPARILWGVTLVAWCIGASASTLEYRKITWFLFGLLAAHAQLRHEKKEEIRSRRTSSVCVASPVF